MTGITLAGGAGKCCIPTLTCCELMYRKAYAGWRNTEALKGIWHKYRGERVSRAERAALNEISGTAGADVALDELESAIRTSGDEESAQTFRSNVIDRRHSH